MWLVINGHTLAGSGSLPAKVEARNRFKAECLKRHIQTGLLALSNLAEAQGDSGGPEKFRNYCITVLGDWNLTLAQAQDALDDLEVQIAGADYIQVMGEGSLFVVAIHPMQKMESVPKMMGFDNFHEVVVATIKWPGPTLQDLLWATAYCTDRHKSNQDLAQSQGEHAFCVLSDSAKCISS